MLRRLVAATVGTESGGVSGLHRDRRNDTLAACVAAVVTTTIGAWIAVPFALPRFRMERRWERREEAYGRILLGLAHLKDYVDVTFDAEARGREVPEDMEADLRAKAQLARREIKTAVDLGGFLLSTEARDRLARFRTRLGL